MGKVRTSWRRLSFEKKLAIVVVPLAVAVIGLVPTMIGSMGEKTPSPTIVVNEKNARIPEFKGVAGHMKQSRALLDFLQQNDGEVVRLAVGFPSLPPEDFIVEDVFTPDGSTLQAVTYVRLFNECTPDLPPGRQPTFKNGCMARLLEINSPPTNDSGGYVLHGVPNLKGYFAVDFTGILQMGERPVILKPLTLEQARGG